MAELAEKHDHDLPDTVGVSQEEIDRYFHIWLLWRMTERRFLPSQLMTEPSAPLAVMLELDGYFDQISKPKEPDSENAT